MNTTKTQIKRSVAVVICITLAMLLLMGAGIKPTNDFFVNDYAGVLSATSKAYIMDKSASLDKETGAQIVVLTIADLEGQDPTSLALSIGREWGIGDEGKDNGLLILLSPQDGEIRVEVGRGLEGALNDAKVGRIIDNYALQAYKDGDFDTGTLELYKALLSEVMQEYGLEALPGYEDAGEEEGFPMLSMGIVGFIIILGIVASMRKGPPGSSGGTHHGGPPIIFFGGGNHRSGGFGGFGGGGGGFSGGGGSFGGGGAGRSF